jgi:hypothetical protein
MDSLVLTNFMRSIYMLGQIDLIETVSYFLSELLSIRTAKFNILI